MKTIEEFVSFAEDAIRNKKVRSAWDKGVNQYAFEILDFLMTFHPQEEADNAKMLEKRALNGAQDWKQYSAGGCSLIYNYDIAKRLCSPSELKKTREGMREPNPRETWIDVQTRALRQAWWKIERIFREFNK